MCTVLAFSSIAELHCLQQPSWWVHSHSIATITTVEEASRLLGPAVHGSALTCAESTHSCRQTSSYSSSWRHGRWNWRCCWNINSSCSSSFLSLFSLLFRCMRRQQEFLEARVLLGLARHLLSVMCIHLLNQSWCRHLLACVQVVLHFWLEHTLQPCTAVTCSLQLSNWWVISPKWNVPCTHISVWCLTIGLCWPYDTTTHIEDYHVVYWRSA